MKIFRILGVVLGSLCFVSCSPTLKPSGFLGGDDAKMTKNKALPFSRSWKNPKAKLNGYSHISIKPMRIDGLRSLDTFARGNLRNVGEIYSKDAATLASLGTQKFQTELGVSPNRKVSISATPRRKKGMMILETNLVQMEPGRPSLEFARFFVPFISLLNRPSIGVEGRFIDASSGETVFAFSDLERAEISLLDLRKFTYYGVHHRELGRWAGQLRQVVDGNGASLVRDPFIVQPLNW